MGRAPDRRTPEGSDRAGHRRYGHVPDHAPGIERPGGGDHAAGEPSAGAGPAAQLSGHARGRPQPGRRPAPLPEAEAWICIGDLPAALGLFTGGAITPRPYLKPDPRRAAQIRTRLQRRHPGKRLVGITWTSRADDGWRRTIPPALWHPVTDIGDVAVVSLQYDANPRDLASFGERIDADHGIEPLHDLDGLTALVAAMDEVVSPTNNTVHFAGALGVPSRVMLPIDPEWRWGEDGVDCRWYDATRLYRQRRDGDWRPVIEAVARDLERDRHGGSRVTTSTMS